ncbi:MAG: DUF721 domain-containing protein, partial [Thermodesulfobacteriota bacterium]
DGARRMKAKPVHLKTVISRILESCRKEPDVGLVKIWDLWDHAVGSIIAENARPAAFKGRLLIVHVSSSAWMQHLRFLKKDLIKKINAALGEELLDEIKFKIGSISGVEREDNE